MRTIAIYKITSPSNAVYIGQSFNLRSRWADYRKYDCKSQPKLYNSLKKYGFNNHILEIISQCDKNISQQSLNNLETMFIRYYKSLGHRMLNCREAGQGETPKPKSGYVGRTQSKKEITKRKDTISKFVYYIDDIHGNVTTTKSIHDFSKKNKINHGGLMHTLYGYNSLGKIAERYKGFRILRRVPKNSRIDMLYYNTIMFEEYARRKNKFEINESVKADKIKKNITNFKFLYKILTNIGEIVETSSLNIFCNKNNISRPSVANTLYGYDKRGYIKEYERGYKLLSKVPIDTTDGCIEKFVQSVELEKIFRKNLRDVNVVRYEIQFPNNSIEFVSNISKFCKEHSLHRKGLYYTLTGVTEKGFKYTQTHGYKLLNIHKPVKCT